MIRFKLFSQDTINDTYDCEHTYSYNKFDVSEHSEQRRCAGNLLRPLGYS